MGLVLFDQDVNMRSEISGRITQGLRENSVLEFFLFQSAGGKAFTGGFFLGMPLGGL